jgi:hypothetical protein
MSLFCLVPMAQMAGFMNGVIKVLFREHGEKKPKCWKDLNR